MQRGKWKNTDTKFGLKILLLMHLNIYSNLCINRRRSKCEGHDGCFLRLPYIDKLYGNGTLCCAEPQTKSGTLLAQSRHSQCTLRFLLVESGVLILLATYVRTYSNIVLVDVEAKQDTQQNKIFTTEKVRRLSIKPATMVYVGWNTPVYAWYYTRTESFVVGKKLHQVQSEIRVEEGCRLVFLKK